MAGILLSNNFNGLQGGSPSLQAGPRAIQGGSPNLQSTNNATFFLQPTAAPGVLSNPAAKINVPQAAAKNVAPPAKARDSPGAGAAAATPVYEDKTNDIALNNAGLGQVDATQASGINAINKALGTVVGNYEGDLGTAKNEYGVTSNA